MAVGRQRRSIVLELLRRPSIRPRPFLIREFNRRQSRGFRSMISFCTHSEETARQSLEHVHLSSYAESLGGVESLITYPMLQTHGDVPKDVRERLGITETFLRMSVGIEHADDLIADLWKALES